MAIDPERVIGAELMPTTTSWDERRVVLYHLGLGAGRTTDDPRELAYAYEARLKVLPCFSAVLAFDSLVGLVRVAGLEFDPLRVLSVGHDLESERVIPPRGSGVTTGRVVALYDRRTAAELIVELETCDEWGQRLALNRFAVLLGGAGGFGGEGPPPASDRPPPRRADREIHVPTLPQQALLYRLSGDLNPLHADPEFARRCGYARPILHGLCTYGAVCKATVDHVLDGDPALVESFRARYAGIVFPGETLIVSLWEQGRHIFAQATTRERGELVLTNAVVTLREPPRDGIRVRSH